MPSMHRYTGYRSRRMPVRTPLMHVKLLRISLKWPAGRQLYSDNQRPDKRVENFRMVCLDGGSSPPISTNKIDNQSIAKDKHDSGHMVQGCVFYYPRCPCIFPDSVPCRTCALAMSCWHNCHVFFRLWNICSWRIMKFAGYADFIGRTAFFCLFVNIFRYICRNISSGQGESPYRR